MMPVSCNTTHRRPGSLVKTSSVPLAPHADQQAILILKSSSHLPSRHLIPPPPCLTSPAAEPPAHPPPSPPPQFPPPYSPHSSPARPHSSGSRLAGTRSWALQRGRCGRRPLSLVYSSDFLAREVDRPCVRQLDLRPRLRAHFARLRQVVVLCSACGLCTS